MFCGLGEEHTKIRKKKKEKKRNEPHRGQKWVGLDERVFLTEIAFHAKLEGRFSGSKTKVT